MTWLRLKWYPYHALLPTHNRTGLVYNMLTQTDRNYHFVTVRTIKVALTTGPDNTPVSVQLQCALLIQFPDRAVCPPHMGQYGQRGRDWCQSLRTGHAHKV